MYKGHIVKNLGQITTEVVAVKTLKGSYIPIIVIVCVFDECHGHD